MCAFVCVCVCVCVRTIDVITEELKLSVGLNTRRLQVGMCAALDATANVCVSVCACV